MHPNGGQWRVHINNSYFQEDELEKWWIPWVFIRGHSYVHINTFLQMVHYSVLCIRLFKELRTAFHGVMKIIPWVGCSQCTRHSRVHWRSPTHGIISIRPWKAVLNFYYNMCTLFYKLVMYNIDILLWQRWLFQLTPCEMFQG